ncbi:MAG: YhjD/YihY/BrkB family envelope integrity protein [Rhodospirillaceae bacterium]
MAASLSYTSLLVAVPLSAIAFAMLAAFPVFEGVRDVFQSILFANFLPDAANSMREHFDRFVRNTATLSAVGIVALALTAVLLVGVQLTATIYEWREAGGHPAELATTALSRLTVVLVILAGLHGQAQAAGRCSGAI